MRLMLTSLEELIEDVRSQGYLAQADLELALCLVGVAPTREKIRRDVLAYAINLFNLGCTPGVSATVVAEWLEPANRPDVLQGVPVDEVFGADAEHNRELLLGQLKGEVERLRAEADRLAREVDGPRLAAVLDRASIPIDEAARRLTRSHAEARTTYHRASSALWPMLEREKEEGSAESFGDDGDGGDDADEAGDAPGAGAAALAEAASAADLRGGGTGPAVAPVSAVPVPVTWEEAKGSQNEPEDMSGTLAQRGNEPEGSVEGRPSGPERQNGVFSPAPALENTPSEAPVEGRGSEGEGDAVTRVAQPAPESVAAAPVPACPEEAKVSQNEPEDAPDALAQRVDESGDSVEGRPSATERQNGVLSLAPALENRLSEAPVEGRGSEGEGDDPGVAARPLPRWVTMVPLSASRRPDGFLTKDEEEAKNGSDQVVDSGASSVAERTRGPGRQNGVSSPAQALQEPPFWDGSDPKNNNRQSV